MPNFHVVGRKENGDTVYYTGKAGQAFVSNQMWDAFEYSSIEQARKRALMLNTGSQLTGIRFIVPCNDVECTCKYDDKGGAKNSNCKIHGVL